MRHCFLQVKAWQSIAGDLSVVLCEGRPAQLSCASPGVVLEADGRRGGVLQDVHQVPELLADVQVEPFGCHDGSAAARVAIKQSPVVEIKTLPALRGERGRFSECCEEADSEEWGLCLCLVCPSPALTPGTVCGSWLLRDSPQGHVGQCLPVPASPSPAAGHSSCCGSHPVRLSPHPAPRCHPQRAGGPWGSASSPQTPPHSTPGPRCAGSSPHLSPCKEGRRC